MPIAGPSFMKRSGPEDRLALGAILGASRGGPWRDVANVGEPVTALLASSLRGPGCADTEEVTGSNPVSPTSGTMVRPCSSGLAPNSRAQHPGRLYHLITWAIGKKAVQSRRSSGQVGLQGSLN